MGLFGNIFKPRHIEHTKQGDWWFYMNELTADQTMSQSYLWYALNNPILFTVLSTRARLFSQMQISHYDKNNNLIPSNKSLIIKALNKPNYFQTLSDLLYSLSWEMYIYGTSYLYYNEDIYSNPDYFKVLNNDKISKSDLKKATKERKFIRTKSDIDKFEGQKIQYNIDQETNLQLKLKDIIPVYDMANGLTHNYIGESRLKALISTLDNIHENIRSKNINLNMSRKYIGVNKTDMNGQPMVSEQDRRSIKKVLGQNDLQITNGNLEFKHLVSDFKRLFLDDMFKADALTIINAFELNTDVINYINDGNATDREIGIISVIQNSIKPQADDFLGSLAHSFNLQDKGERLVASYDHLPVMQNLMKDKVFSLSNGINAYANAVSSGIFTTQEARQGVQDIIQRLKI